MTGRAKEGKVTMENLKGCLEWALKNMKGAEMDIWVLMKMASDYPTKAQSKLAELFAKCSPRDLPPIFRHLFGKDEDFKATWQIPLQENMVGMRKSISDG